MAKQHPDAAEEWLAHRIESWVETYKKAMLTPVLLKLVATHQPLTVAELTEQVTVMTGWQLTERGLYRSVQRLQEDGFLFADAIDAPRTGAQRKLLSLTPLGERFLGSISDRIIWDSA